MIYKNTSEAMEVVRGFENRTLSKAAWTHDAHLTVGLYYCLRFPFGTALNRMRDGIKAINKAHGVGDTDPGGYHETMTVFWMLVIKQFAETSKCYGFGELANQIIGICGDPRLPLEYYSPQVLFSEEARREHVHPDREELFLFVNSAKLAAQTGGFQCTEFA